jgi:hypothetical protein
MAFGPVLAYVISANMEKHLDEKRRIRKENGDDVVSLGISLSEKSQVNTSVSSVSRLTFWCWSVCCAQLESACCRGKNRIEQNCWRGLNEDLVLR